MRQLIRDKGTLVITISQLNLLVCRERPCVDALSVSKL
jgi:hypothetical protein